MATFELVDFPADYASARMSRIWANPYPIVQTERGTFRAVYHPGAPDEYVIVVGPGDEQVSVPTPALVGFGLAVEGGELVIWWLQRRDGSGEAVEHRTPSGVMCGQPVAAHTFGGVGPIGPAGAPGPQGERGEQGPAGPAGEDAVALTADDIDRIAERVWLMPPPEHLKDLAGVDLGALSQIVIAYLWTRRQDFHAATIPTMDEAVIGLLAGGYQPKVNQGG
jgi:hypothetical protein